MSSGEETAVAAAATSRDRFEPHDTGRMLELAGTELASFGARAGAYLCDVLLAALALVAVVGLSAPLWGRWFKTRNVHLEIDFHNWYSLVWMVLYFGLAAYWGHGQTPGKRLFRIRIVSLVHRRLTLWESFERALGYAASVGELGFGFLQFFTHPNHRTLHDRIAETIVVREPRRAKARTPRAAGPNPSLGTAVE